MTSEGVAAQANVIRGGTRRRKWTPGVLAPVSVEGSVTVSVAEGGSRVVYGELHQRDERGPIILTPIDEGAEYVRNHAVHTFGARVGIMMVRRSEDERCPQGRVQGCPELRRKPTSRKTDATKFPAAVAEVAVSVKGGCEPDTSS